MIVLKLSSFSRNVKQRREDACLKTTQFTHNGTYYQQVFGTAMGSPVSAVIANMVMEGVEQRALATSPVKPFFWKRYVAFEFNRAVDPIHP